MNLRINRVLADNDCVFNTLRLAVIVDYKEIDLETLHFRVGKAEGRHRVYRPKACLTLRNPPTQVTLVVNPEILNLQTPYQTTVIFPGQRENIIVQTQLGDFQIEYNMEISKAQSQSVKRVQYRAATLPPESSYQVSQFIPGESKVSECSLCQATGIKSKQSQIMYPLYRPAVQDLIKENVQLKYKLNQVKESHLKETSEIMREIDAIQESSTQLVIQNIRKKKDQQRLKNGFESERLVMMQKILHLRDLLDRVGHI